MSFLLSAATVAMTEHCDSFSEQLRELVKQLQIVVYTDNPEFAAIKRQILEWADEIDAQNENQDFIESGNKQKNSAELSADAASPSLSDVNDLCEEHCFNVEGYESLECLQGLIMDAIARWGAPAVPPTPPIAEDPQP